MSERRKGAGLDSPGQIGDMDGKMGHPSAKITNNIANPLRTKSIKAKILYNKGTSGSLRMVRNHQSRRTRR